MQFYLSYENIAQRSNRIEIIKNKKRYLFASRTRDSFNCSGTVRMEPPSFRRMRHRCYSSKLVRRLIIVFDGNRQVCRMRLRNCEELYFTCGNRYRDDYDEKEVAAPTASATSNADGLVKPAAPISSVYARPRAPPKIRRPVPLSEQDRYAYKTTPAQPTGKD